MLVEKYFLVVLGKFEKVSLEFENQPNENDIIKAIESVKGESARIEKRYVLVKGNE